MRCLFLGAAWRGCYAAIAAARRGQSVVVVEKGATEKWVRREAVLTTGNLPVQIRVQK